MRVYVRDCTRVGDAKPKDVVKVQSRGLQGEQTILQQVCENGKENNGTFQEVFTFASDNRHEGDKKKKENRIFLLFGGESGEEANGPWGLHHR